MLFQTLKISNFGSIGEMELPLADQGLALIMGRNEDAPKADSNGAGKSLPLDAFTWALWGNTVRGFGSDEVVHNKVGADCKVTVTLSEKGTDYEVTRYRRNKEDKDHKPNDLILRANGEEVSGASISDTQTMVEEILGLDFTTFCAMMPGAGINVATMTDAEVKSLLEKLLRTEALGKASEEARKRHRESEKALTIATTKQTAKLNSLLESKKRIEELEALEKDYDAEQEGKTTEVETSLATLEKHKADWVKIADTEPAALAAKGEIMTALGGCEDLIQGFVSSIKKTDTHYQDKLAKLGEDKVAEAVRLETACAAVESLEGLSGLCGCCYQSVSEAHCKQQLCEWSVKQRVLEIKVSTIEESQKVTREKWHAEKEEFQTLVAEQTISQKHHNTQLVRAESELKAAQEAKAEVKRFDELILTRTEQLKNIKDETNPYLGLLESEEVSFINKQQEYDKLKNEIADQRKYEQILSFWVDSFSPQGIRSFMLEHVTPLLNQFAKKYADLVTDGEMEITFHTKDTLKSGKSKERFNIQVSQKHGGSSYASNSSGERARANLIIALALGELAALRAEKSIPFRFLDEPFENIDEAGTEAIVILLNQQRDKYNTVYVITHQDHFKQLFPNRKTIVKKGGFSSLEED
jgi:DNA repair exonuclease SbcCD ATPase subunit